MILPYDQLIDTREKRLHLLIVIFLGLAVIYVIPYLFLGFTLSTTSSYTSLYSLLAQPIVTMCYLSRIILDAISLSSFDLMRVLTLLIDNSSIMEVLVAISFVLVLPVLLRKKQLTICMILLLLETSVSTALLLIALRSGTLSQAISYLRIIGVVFLCVNTMLMILLTLALKKELLRYKKALAWDVEEIKEA